MADKTLSFLVQIVHLADNIEESTSIYFTARRWSRRRVAYEEVGSPM
jgi:hypothetical protein